MAYIYKITNSVNDKVYVGKTTVSIEVRWQQHKNSASCKKNRFRSKLYSAMRKYGRDKFHIEEIEECGIDCVDERERYWIAELDSVRNGYNITTGGDGYSIIDDYAEKEVLTLWKDGKMQNEISSETGINAKKVKRILYENGITRQEILNRQYDYYKTINSKSVYSYDMNGMFVAEYPSIREASADTWVHYTTIGHILNGRYESAKGLTFRDYKQDRIDFVRTVFPKAKKVFQYGLDGTFIGEYKSCLSAASAVGIYDGHTIAKSCKNHESICGGYQWRYFKADKIDAADTSDGRHMSKVKLSI